MKYLLGTFALILILTLVSSCYSDNKEDLYENYSTATDTTGCDTATVTFAEVKPLLVANCAISGCHSGSSPQSNLDLNTFSAAQRIASDGRLKSRITNNPGPVMPPGGKLPQNEIDIILQWAINPCP